MTHPSYESARIKYKPAHISFLLIAESPPPPPEVQSSRQFYYADRLRKDDRLFTNTMRALYSDAVDLAESELEESKTSWLTRFQKDGFYMIEALEESQIHEVTKEERKRRIHEHLPDLIKRVKALADKDTKLILIKSNVFEEAAEPLRKAGFTVLNNELLDYPGRFNQKAYREKLANYVKQYRN